MMNLTNFIQQQFRPFAMVMAALVTTCALNLPAHARIIYHSVNVVIDDTAYNLDINGDGVVDFSISAYEYFSHYQCAGGAQVDETSASGNGTMFGPLHLGDPIGPDQMFGGAGTLEWIYYSNGICLLYRGGPWITAKNGYLGFSLQVEGQTYYGWAKLINLKSYSPPDVAVQLVGYAYEDTPGMAIAAGQTK